MPLKHTKYLCTYRSRPKSSLPYSTLHRSGLLPYHKYAEAKYASLGIDDISPSVLPKKDDLEKAKETIRKICGDKVL